MEFTEDDISMVMNIIRTPMTTINCRTEEEAKQLLSMLGNQEIYWASGDIASDHTNWTDYMEETVYHLVDGSLKFGTVGWARSHDYNIIYFDDILASQVSLLDILSA